MAKDLSLVPPGWWMVFAVDSHGIPSKARWAKVRTAVGAEHVSTPRTSPCRREPPPGRTSL